MSETRSSQRFHSLNAEQVEVLHQVLSEVVPIHGRGNFPTLELRPRDIIIAVRARLQKQGITVRDVRLNGSTASHVLVRDNGTSYKDLDIIFGVELPSQEEFQVRLVYCLVKKRKQVSVIRGEHWGSIPCVNQHSFSCIILKHRTKYLLSLGCCSIDFCGAILIMMLL